MTTPQSKNYYEPPSIDHFEALEQTCRLRQLSGSGEKYLLFQLEDLIKATVVLNSKFFLKSTVILWARSDFEDACTVPLCSYKLGSLTLGKYCTFV